MNYTEVQANAVLALYVACSVAYVGLGVLAATTDQRRTTSVLFVLATALTALWSLAISMSFPNTSFALADNLDHLRAFGWYGLMLQVYRQTVPRSLLVLD